MAIVSSSDQATLGFSSTKARKSHGESARQSTPVSAITVAERGPPVDQSHLAERVAGAELVAGLTADRDRGISLDDHEEPGALVALSRDHLGRVESSLAERACEALELAPLHRREQRNTGQGVYRVDGHDPIIERSASSDPNTTRRGWCYTGPGARRRSSAG